MSLLSKIKNVIGVAPAPPRKTSRTRDREGFRETPLSTSGGNGGRVAVGGASRPDELLPESSRAEYPGRYFTKPPPPRQPRIHPATLATLIEKHSITLARRDEILVMQVKWAELIEASKKFSYDAIRAEAREIRRRMREGDVDAASEEPVSYDSVREDAGIRKHSLRQAANAISAECPSLLAPTASAIESAAKEEHAELEAIERQTAEAYGVDFRPSPALESLEYLCWSPSMICASPGVGSSPRQQCRQIGFSLP